MEKRPGEDYREVNFTSHRTTASNSECVLSTCQVPATRSVQMSTLNLYNSHPSGGTIISVTKYDAVEAGNVI